MFGVAKLSMYISTKYMHIPFDKGSVFAFAERALGHKELFHLLVGEMTITLYDESSLLHILIIGAFLTITVFDNDHT